MQLERLDLLRACTGSDWNGVSFLRSSLYVAVLWICDYKSVDNTPVFRLLLSRLSVFPALPPRWVVWTCTRNWEETQPLQQDWTDQRDTPCYIASCLVKKKGNLLLFLFYSPSYWGERERVCVCVVLRCLPGLSHQRASLGSQVFHPLKMLPSI